MFYCLFDLSCGECDVISMYLCVALLMDLFVLCVVFVNCLVKQIAICLGVVAIFLLNGSVWCVWRCFVGYTVYGLPKNVHVVSVIPVCI